MTIHLVVELKITLFGQLFCFIHYNDKMRIKVIEMKRPYDAVCSSVEWSVCWSVCHNFLGGKFQFHAPIGALVQN